MPRRRAPQSGGLPRVRRRTGRVSRETRPETPSTQHTSASEGPHRYSSPRRRYVDGGHGGHGGHGGCDRWHVSAARTGAPRCFVVPKMIRPRDLRKRPGSIVLGEGASAYSSLRRCSPGAAGTTRGSSDCGQVSRSRGETLRAARLGTPRVRPRSSTHRRVRRPLSGAEDLGYCWGYVESGHSERHARRDAGAATVQVGVPRETGASLSRMGARQRLMSRRWSPVPCRVDAMGQL